MYAFISSEIHHTEIYEYLQKLELNWMQSSSFKMNLFHWKRNYHCKAAFCLCSYNSWSVARDDSHLGTTNPQVTHSLSELLWEPNTGPFLFCDLVWKNNFLHAYSNYNCVINSGGSLMNNSSCLQYFLLPEYFPWPNKADRQISGFKNLQTDILGSIMYCPD